ncbi:MAG: hypothetical protein DMG79_13515 [Acidobacteria bacterium]|nr:MAG: hypothetical protein DMG79_13515 [Acidobacteriota bacterium]
MHELGQTCGNSNQRVTGARNEEKRGVTRCSAQNCRLQIFARALEMRATVIKDAPSLYTNSYTGDLQNPAVELNTRRLARTGVAFAPPEDDKDNCRSLPERASEQPA